jgi:NhaP-type Na+/H+ or K+/H+ antiporter
MSVESTMRMDVAHVFKNFLHVLKFTVLHLVLCVYALTLAIFLVFDFPAKGFEELVFCVLLSILIYGTDASIMREFFKEKKSRLTEMLEIEGMISGPIVVIFVFFLINYIQAQSGDLSAAALAQAGNFLKEVVVDLLLGISVAWLTVMVLRHFDMSGEMKALFIITIGTLTLIIGELIRTDGSFAVVFFGLFLRTFAKERISNVYNTMLAHLIYIILFIILGMQFTLPKSQFWLQSFGVFLFYLLIRFACVIIFLKNITFREKCYFTLNAAKGIEVAVALFLMTILFRDVAALQMVASLGFLIMLFSWIIATLANHYSDSFLERRAAKKSK